MKEQTVAAISTPLAPGGIGIIRISGEEAFAIADRVFRPISGEPLSSRRGYTAALGRVFDGEEEVDEAIATVFRAPKSYTGENVVELSCHGGMVVCRRVLRAVLEAGAALAGPGEFTKRAYLNGRLSLTQAEGVMDLIGAASDEAAKAARAAMDGALFRQISSVKESLLELSGHISAYMDYPEEEIDPVSSQEAEKVLLEVKGILSRLLASFDRGKVLREGVETVIAGRPNVGKSTLMNLLSGCRKSIVTDIPGTTRDVVEETVNLEGILLRLSDTAGIRETKDAVEQAGVDLALERLAGAGLILAVFDSSLPLSREDVSLVERLRGRPAIAVCNKTDLEEKIDKAYIRENFQHIVEISAKDGTGLKELRQAILQLLELDKVTLGGAALASARQYDCARRAALLTEEALATVKAGYTLDAAGVAVDGILSPLLELTGERVTEAVVDQVFSHFCVGK